MAKYFQIARYILAGGIAVLTNLIVLFVLVQYFHIWYLISASISFCGAVAVSYVLQKFFVFRNYGLDNTPRQFLHFFFYQIFMLGLNAILMYSFVDGLHIWYLLAQTISAAITACLNYLYFQKFIFNNKGNDQKA